ncbi:hypothetical protein J2Z17_001251 [Rhizobium halophytocola]|uniref:Uncharacterized protein n=1 Tax=Rhizobium halophytocola TaxID=735519 RepID=A0ABS4DVZ2_9HYPH|nr:hypothetical protein [Rhizobium halophytocola]
MPLNFLSRETDFPDNKVSVLQGRGHDDRLTACSFALGMIDRVAECAALPFVHHRPWPAFPRAAPTSQGRRPT